LNNTSTSSRVAVKRGAARTSDRVSASRGRESTTGEFTVIKEATGRAHSRVRDRALESAVYAYLQALRARNRTQVTPSEIANALSISVDEVLSILAALKNKGVKVR
jgi:hypothetical protein